MTVVARKPPGVGREVTLGDRYDLVEGRVFLSGIQALVRVLLDQHRVDARAGLHTGTFVSGYQGSPLAGFDKEVARLGERALEHEIVFQPGVNEELAATSVWGSQIIQTLPNPRYDGVVGVWYGKAPGVDRSADAIRHGNFVGAAPKGGVLALCGDDPASKSSTLPSSSEGLLAALQVPVLAPGSVQELLDLGRHAIACSRASGLWVAMKIVTVVADSTGTVDVGLDRVSPIMPTLEEGGVTFAHEPSANLIAPNVLELENSIAHKRLDLAKRYARLNDLNRITHDPSGARLGIVCSGAAYQDLLQALHDLGLGDQPPVRILKVGMLFPLDEEVMRRFANHLSDILVIEEKGPFLERLLRDALYGGPSHPQVHGGWDESGKPLVPVTGALEADAIGASVGRWLLDRMDLPGVRARLDQLEAVAARPAAALGVQRMPYFCSGCPHNSSLVAEDDAVVGAGIGCHTMVVINPQGRGSISGVTQMGGEGTQWIGAAPFLQPRHFVQNMGDGTYHHSGALAIRAAVAAKLNVTFKLLYNDAVAMTGGQGVEGQLPVPELARSLAAEGVQRIVVTTEDLSRYRGVKLPDVAEVRDRSRVLETQRELAKVEGVTVMLHDQRCAAELRRDRKRGRAPEPPQQVLINERVCEGCGDCGEKSSCLSVEPVETEFGRKTRIHQASCNKDFSCLEGDCPSFLTVVPPKSRRRDHVSAPPEGLPDPQPRTANGDVRVRLVGIGGTGVVTVSQVLGMAALLDGKHGGGVDQTGLSQKAGPVVSDVRISTEPPSGSTPPSSGSVDALLAFDVVGAANPRSLRAADPERTVAVVSTSAVPTSSMVVNPESPNLDSEAAVAAIGQVTRESDNVYFDAQAISNALFDDHMPANIIGLGAAWQNGVIPLSHEALHEALRLNGRAVDANIAAFEWGRAAVAAPDSVAALLGQDSPSQPADVPLLVDRVAPEEGELRRLMAIRVSDLLAWGGRRAAERYVDSVARVQALERERVSDSDALSEAVARYLYKLIAYKDEYEVARLHVDWVGGLDRGAKLTFHLHPPVLRAMGMRKKLKLGRWFLPFLRLLRHGRRLRGTPFDPFGYTRVRRVERSLPVEYLELVNGALDRLSPETIATAVEIAELPDMIRGYEEIKLDSVERFRARARELQATLEEQR